MLERKLGICGRLARESCALELSHWSLQCTENRRNQISTLFCCSFNVPSRNNMRWRKSLLFVFFGVREFLFCDV